MKQFRPKNGTKQSLTKNDDGDNVSIKSFMSQERQNELMKKAKNLRKNINDGLKKRYKKMQSSFEKKQTNLKNKLKKLQAELQIEKEKNLKLEQELIESRENKQERKDNDDDDDDDQVMIESFEIFN